MTEFLHVLPEVGSRLRVGQINLQGSMASITELERIIKVRKLDVALIQEPYSRQGRIAPIGRFRIYHVPNPAVVVVVVNERGGTLHQEAFQSVS